MTEKVYDYEGVHKVFMMMKVDVIGLCLHVHTRTNTPLARENKNTHSAISVSLEYAISNVASNVKVMPSCRGP
jgi:hypothetical protein